MRDIYAVILAGGKGRRFWPFSRSDRPKQFLDITGRGSMLRLTFQRCTRLVPPERVLLITVAGMEASAARELPEIAARNIFAEPVGRNTAPSIAVAAELVRHRGGDAPMLCCPADHLIGREEEFDRLVCAAADVAARSDVLITFGIEPDRPATGYGYIEAGAEAVEHQGRTFFTVDRFHEKPDIESARSYLERGSFFWNSGIFMWRPSVFLEAWGRYVPEGIEPLGRIVRSFEAEGGKNEIAEEFPLLPSISVDHAILEKAENVLVSPAALEWSDVGSWDSLFDLLPADRSGNRVAGYVQSLDSRGNLFYNPAGTTVAIGVEDTVVVVEGSAILVCKRGQSQKVREALERMEREGKKELL